MRISCSKVADYLVNYIKLYREQYDKMIENGYLDIVNSPYLHSSKIDCYLAKDGVMIADYSNQPKYQWDVVGGPALMTDYELSRVPKSIISFLKSKGIYGKPNGIIRIVSKKELPKRVWNGEFPELKDSFTSKEGNIEINVYQYNLSRNNLCDILTFGTFPTILDLKLQDKNSHFWNPTIIKRLGFVPADRNNKRFFNYLELLNHIDMAAWDKRNIKVRVAHDIRRDFALQIGSNNGGSITINYEEQMKPFNDKLLVLKNSISEFESLLEDEKDSNEEVFHAYLKANPILLDIYGEAISKPRLKYPNIEESPLGKTYVEPDFLIKYPFDHYRLIELEKPSKGIATKVGHPRSEITQTTFQIAEWKSYIMNHYELIKMDYPSINFNCITTVVIGRDSDDSFGRNRNIRQYKELLKIQFSVDEILTYDDLVLKAKGALQQLSALI